MELIYYVSIIAQLLTYASFLSGAKVCQIIYREKSCVKLSAAPFLAGLNCTALWLRYGFLADEWEIIAVNSVGLVCQLFYLGFFVVYSRQKQRLFKQVIILILFLSFLLWSINHAVDPLFVGGSYASVSSLLACASPLATIQDVLRTKCVASLPFPIIASSFVVSLSWLIFGYLKEDNFIVFSNLVACSISGAQLILFVIYPSTMPYEKLSQSNKKSYVSVLRNHMTAFVVLDFSCSYKFLRQTSHDSLVSVHSFTLIAHHELQRNPLSFFISPNTNTTNNNNNRNKSTCLLAEISRPSGKRQTEEGLSARASESEEAKTFRWTAGGRRAVAFSPINKDLSRGFLLFNFGFTQQSPRSMFPCRVG